MREGFAKWAIIALLLLNIAIGFLGLVAKDDRHYVIHITIPSPPTLAAPGGQAS